MQQTPRVPSDQRLPKYLTYAHACVHIAKPGFDCCKSCECKLHLHLVSFRFPGFPLTSARPENIMPCSRTKRRRKDFSKAPVFPRLYSTDSTRRKGKQKCLRGGKVMVVAEEDQCRRRRGYKRQQRNVRGFFLYRYKQFIHTNDTQDDTTSTFVPFRQKRQQYYHTSHTTTLIHTWQQNTI